MATLAEMTAKREEVMARAKVLRSVAGSGYHDNDATGPVKMNQPPIDEHAVAFKGVFETIFIAPCASKVIDGLANYLAKHGHRLQESRLDPDERTWLETAREYESAALSADGCLVVRNAQWNAVLAVLELEKIGVTSTAV